MARVLALLLLGLTGSARAYDENPTLNSGPRASQDAQEQSPAATSNLSDTGKVVAKQTPVAEVEAEEYVVRGRAANLLGKAGSATSGTVSQEDLSHRALLRPAEVLEAVPGLLITQHSGDGKANQYFTRGFNLDHGTDFSFNVDGVPVNMQSSAHAEGYTDLNFLIPDLVKEVNYTKGPFSVEYGDFSTAGSANFVYPLTLRKSVASVTLGEFGYLRGLVASSMPLLGGNLLYAMEGAAYDGPWDTPENNKKYNGLLRYSTGNESGRWVLTGLAYSASWTATNQTPLRAVTEGLIGGFGSFGPSDGGNSRRDSLTGNWEGHALGGHGSAMAYVTNSHMQLWNDFTFFLRDPNNGDQIEQEDDRTMSGAKLKQEYEVRLAGLPTRNEIGIDFRNDNITTLGLYDTRARLRLSTVSLNHVVETSEAPYAQNITQWTPWLRTTIGFREDFFHINVMGDTRDTTGLADTGLPEPKASLAIRPWAGPFELYANYGWSFHTNDGRIITPASLSGIVNVSTVSPLVQAKGGELGMRYASGNTYEGTIAVWLLNLDSELTFDGDAAASGIGKPSTRQGLELSNTFRLSPIFLDLDYALSQARFDVPDDDDPAHAGDYVPEAVENAATATFGLEKMNGWSADARVRFFGSRALVADNSVRSPDSILLSLRLTRDLGPNQSLNFDMFNVLDTRVADVSYYYASRLQGEPPQGVADVHQHLTEPRSVRVTLVERY